MAASAQKVIINRPPTPMIARQPVVVRSTPGAVHASSLRISSPADAAEREADQTARRIMRMPLPQTATSITARSSPHAARFAGAIRQNEPLRVARKPETPAAASPGVAAEIGSSQSSGQPLPSGVRKFMEPRFSADFSRVGIHTGEQAAKLNRQVSAQAFTVGNQIYFGRNRFQPESGEGRELIAHELTHTIQQGAAVQRSAEPTIAQKSPALIQRLFGLDARSFLAGKAAVIPGFTMLTVLIGSNPITGEPVARSAGNILKGALEMIPVVGVHITSALNNHGIFDRVSVWAEQQFKTLGDIGSAIRQNVADFIKNFDITSPIKMWERGKQIVTEPIARIGNFAASLVSGIGALIKEAILKPIAAFAKANAPNGYDLLCGVLGKDPISGEAVPRSAETLIPSFLKLLGQEEVWENIKKANAIARAWAWFQNALGKVRGFVQEVPAMFLNAFKSLEMIDIVLIPRAFAKLAGVFGGFVGRFIDWAGNAVWNLLEIIFDSVKPGLMGYIRKTGAALKSILKNPLPFVGNLVNAAKLGFNNFSDGFSGHLKTGLIEWLTGSLEGVYIPQALTLPELGKFALSVLGITWAQIRGKFVTALGPTGETLMRGLESGFDMVIALVKGGPAALWELIKEKLSDLKDTVTNGIVSLVADTIVKKAIPKLVALFIPGAGFISAIISIYDTIMVFVQKISKIIQVVNAFIDSIVTIAAGNIGAAAKRVESVLAGLLSLAISFLAGFFGLGKVTDKIRDVIEKIRDKVGQAIDSAINWVVTKVKALFGKAKETVGKAVEWWKQRKPFKTKGGRNHEIYFTGDEKNPVPMVASNDPKPVEQRLAEFERKASSSSASAEQKQARTLIEKTQTTVKKDPNAPSLLSDLKSCFELFEEGTAGRKKETVVKRTTGKLWGDTVGLEMTIDWLNHEYEEKHKGSEPQSGEQDKLMNRLVTEPIKGRRSADKFIRGHLLNEHLGGKGVAENMFPLTGNANSLHLYSTETYVKKWMKKTDRWIWYEVKVRNVSSRLDASDIRNNYIDCTLECRAILKDDTGKKEEDFSTHIPSVYTEKHHAERTDNMLPKRARLLRW